MNYIKQLEARVEELERARIRAREEIDCLLVFLSAARLRRDQLKGYVNIDDVHVRLSRVRAELIRGENSTGR